MQPQCIQFCKHHSLTQRAISKTSLWRSPHAYSHYHRSWVFCGDGGYLLLWMSSAAILLQFIFVPLTRMMVPLKSFINRICFQTPWSARKMEGWYLMPKSLNRCTCTHSSLKNQAAGWGSRQPEENWPGKNYLKHHTVGVKCPNPQSFQKWSLTRLNKPGVGHRKCEPSRIPWDACFKVRESKIRWKDEHLGSCCEPMSWRKNSQHFCPALW